MSVGAVAGSLGWQAFGLSVGRRYWAPGLLWVSGARLEVHGLKKLDRAHVCVLVANHQSMFDVVALQVALPADLRFIAKTELLRVPFLGAYLRTVGMICIDRRNTAASVTRLQDLAKTIATDHAFITAFIEGTRSRSGVIQPFKKGAFMLAMAAKVPVVPISITGAREILPADSFKVRPGVVRIDIGDPIPTENLKPLDCGALIEKARHAITTMNVAAGGLGAGKAELGGCQSTAGAIELGHRGAPT